MNVSIEMEAVVKNALITMEVTVVVVKQVTFSDVIEKHAEVWI